MKRKICSALLVVLVSAFSFASGSAQTISSGTSTMMTSYQVTTVGSTNWATTLTAPAGTTVSWLLSYHNMGTANVGKLIISSSLVSNQTLVPGSVMWFDGNFPNGYKLSDTGLFDAGVDVGGVAAGTNGFIRYRTQSVEATPCGIKSESAGYFDADGVKSTYKATFSTPACIEPIASSTVQVPPTTVTTATATPVATADTTTHDHTTTTDQQTTTTSSSASSVTSTSGSVTATATPVTTTATSSPTTATVHEGHTTSTPASTDIVSSAVVTSTNVVPATDSTSLAQTTNESESTVHDHSVTSPQVTTTAPVVAQATQVATLTATEASTHTNHDVSTQTAAATQVAGASNEPAAHSDHTTTTSPTVTTSESTEHAGHTIPATGGNPLWLMSGALALGYIGKLLFLKRRMRTQPVMIYWQ